ncbi:MAG: hypothetical protein V1685_07300 [Parcubacteria group bacterium]
MNRSLYMCIVALMLLVLSSCTGEKKKLETELKATKAQISILEGDVRRARDYNQDLVDSNHACRTVLDMAMNTIDSISGRNAALRVELKATKAQYEQSLTELTRRCDNAEAKLALDEREIDSLTTNIEQFVQAQQGLTEQLNATSYRLLHQFRPWYDYYRHQAHRSWWQHTWGKGNASKPEFPEPEF